MSLAIIRNLLSNDPGRRARAAIERGLPPALAEVCQRAALTEKQSLAWVLGEMGFKEKAIGTLFGPLFGGTVSRDVIAEHKSKARLKLQRYSPDGITNGLIMAQDEVDAMVYTLSVAGPWGEESVDAAHRGYHETITTRREARGEDRLMELAEYGGDMSVVAEPKGSVESMGALAALQALSEYGQRRRPGTDEPSVMGHRGADYDAGDGYGAGGEDTDVPVYVSENATETH